MNQSTLQHKSCYYCRRLFNENITRTKDHAIAKSKGGFDIEENYVDCCYNCNKWKADNTLEKWLEIVKKYLDKGRHRVYNNIQLGQIVGNIKKLLKELKSKKTISVYKPK